MWIGKTMGLRRKEVVIVVTLAVMLRRGEAGHCVK